MRVPVALATLCLVAGACALPVSARAQADQSAPPPGSMAPPPGAMMGPQGAPGGRGQARFDAANVTHDGRLTLQQAQAANWRAIAEHFQEIDKDNKGYVTKQDIRQWARARRAARASGGAMAPGGMAPGSMAPGAMAPGAMAPGAMAPGNMPPGAPPAPPPSGQQY